MNNKLLLVLAVSGLSLNTMAATLFVKTDGVNSNSCVSWIQACQTIDNAVGKAEPKDEINIAGGVYVQPSTINITDKDLTLIGGFKDGLLLPNPDKFPTVITGDIDDNDANRVGGVTTDWNNIDASASNLSQWLSVTNSDVSLKNLTITAMKGDDGNVVHFSVSTASNTLSLNNIKVIGNQSNSNGAILLSSSANARAHLNVNNCVFEGNQGDAGSAITSLDTTAIVKVDFSSFINNDAVDNAGGLDFGSGGAIRVLSDLTVKSSLFEGNTATADGGAIYSDVGVLHIENSTFVDNTAGSTGGALYLAGDGNKQISYSSFYNNSAVGNGGAIESSAPTSLVANIILGNTGAAGANINATPAKVVDAGFNIIGFIGTTGVNGFTITAPSISLDGVTPGSTTIDEVFETTLAYNGGKTDSLRLQTGVNIARDMVAYDGIPFFGVGQSAQWPFTSLSQAHGALKGNDAYTAGKYYFDLGGVYSGSGSNITLAKGGVNDVFSTYIDNNGYVLVASADAGNPSSGTAPATQTPYTQTRNLVDRSDTILDAAVFTHANFDVSEVRISSYSDDDRGTFDGYSISADVITQIKLFKSLPNSFEPTVAWTVTHSSSGLNYFSSTAAGVTADLDSKIYASDSDAGIHWIPLAPNESLIYPDSVTAPKFADNLDLWVRGTSGVCNGTVSVDGRGLPRSDRVKHDEAVPNCDVGSFEHNNFFRLDCNDEDGGRPEFSTTSYSVSTCISDVEDLSPAAFAQNLGSVNPFHLMLLLVMGLGFHSRKRESSIN